MFRVGTFSLAVILALSIATDSATSKDQPDTHEVVPLTKMPPGQWFVKVWGRFRQARCPVCDPDTQRRGVYRSAAYSYDGREHYHRPR